MRTISEIIGLTLLHFLWQGAAIAGLYAVVRACQRRASSNARYLTTGLAMAAMVASCVGTFWWLSGGQAPVAPDEVSTPQAAEALLAGLPAMAVTEASTMASSALTWITKLWSLGVLLLSVRAFYSWVRLRKLLRLEANISSEWQQKVTSLARQMGLSRAVGVVCSVTVDNPMVAGSWRPVILLPVAALAGLPAEQLEALLVHELAHIRRHDYFWNLLQTVVETVLFYHPAVWWVGNCMRQEREHCCDDIAVAHCGDRLLYANALTGMESLRQSSWPSLAPAANGGHLLSRIQRLLVGQPSQTFQPGLRWVAGLAVMSVLVASLSLAGPQSQGGPQSPNAPQAPASPEALIIAQAPAAPPAPANRPSPFPPPPPRPAAVPNAAAVPNPVAAPAPVAPAAPPAPPTAPGRPDDSDRPDDPNEPDFMAQIQATGLKPSFDQLVAMKIHRVSPAFVKEMRAAGINASIDQLIAARIHRVDAAELQAMRKSGLDVDLEKAIALKIHRVTAVDLDKWKALGLPVNLDQAMALKIHRISPEELAAWRNAGFSQISIEQLMALQIHRATPAMLQQFAAIGFAKLTPEELVESRIFKVTPAFVQQARQRGFTDLNFRQLSELKRLRILRTADEK